MPDTRYLEEKIKNLEEKFAEKQKRADDAMEIATDAKMKLERALVILAAAALSVVILFGVAWTQIPKNAIKGVDGIVKNKVDDHVETLDIGTIITARLSTLEGEVLIKQGSVDSSGFMETQGGLYTTVSTDLSNFNNPKIFASLQGKGWNWKAIGPTIYPHNLYNGNRDFNAEGFDVMLYPGSTGIPDILKEARENEWVINWMVIDIQ